MVEEPISLRLDKARELLSQYKFGEAMTELEIVLAKLESTPAGTAERALAHELAGESAHRMGAFPQAQEHLQQAAVLLDELGEEQRLLRCQLFLAECLLRQGNIGAASHLVADSEQRAAASGFADVLAQCMVLRGSIAWSQGRLSDALVCCAQAVAEFERLGSQDELNWAKSSLAICHAMLGDDERATTLFEESLHFFETAGNYTQTARCLNNLGGIAFAREDFDRAREYLLRCVDLESDIQARGDMAPTWLNLGLIEIWADNLKQAKKYLHRSLQVAVEVGDIGSEGVAMINLGIVALLEGNLDEAVNYSRLSTACFEGSTSSNAERFQCYLPVFLLAHGRLDAAMAAWAARPNIEDPLELRSLAALLARVRRMAAEPGSSWPPEAVEITRSWLDDLAPFGNSVL